MFKLIKRPYLKLFSISVPKPILLNFSSKSKISKQDELETKMLPKANTTLGTIPSKIKIRFSTPSKVIHKNKEIDSVLLSTTNGLMTFLPAHVPSFQEIMPGIISINNERKVEKWVTSSGYAIIHSDSTCDINVIEAMQLSDIDVKKIDKYFEKSKKKQETNERKMESMIYSIYKQALQSGY